MSDVVMEVQTTDDGLSSVRPPDLLRDTVDARSLRSVSKAVLAF